nr:hypothetical protein [Candidatus Frankia alpina]
MSLAPRAALVHRRTEYAELLDRHGTRGQAAFFLASRGRELAEVQAAHDAAEAARWAAAAAIPPHWRRGEVERTDLDRFLFAPYDVVVCVGQDGLVANVAKYLDGQLVLGINAQPARTPGVLVRLAPGEAAALLRTVDGSPADAARGLGRLLQELTMVEARSDDGQRIVALNEVYVGDPGHQTARYRLRVPTDGGAPVSERQASSGLLVGTGTGATGWRRSVWAQRRSELSLPAPTSARWPGSSARRGRRRPRAPLVPRAASPGRRDWRSWWRRIGWSCSATASRRMRSSCPGGNSSPSAWPTAACASPDTRRRRGMPTLEDADAGGCGQLRRRARRPGREVQGRPGRRSAPVADAPAGGRRRPPGLSRPITLRSVRGPCGPGGSPARRRSSRPHTPTGPLVEHVRRADLSSGC